MKNTKMITEIISKEKIIMKFLKTNTILPIIIVVISLSVMPQVTQAVDTKDEEWVKDIIREAMDERDAEKEVDDLFSGGALDNMLFHGYVDLEWKNRRFDLAQGGSKGRNYFDNHHFNLWFGYTIADNLSALGELEIEHAGEEWKVEFAEMKWKPFSDVNIELLMGKIIVPVGLEHRAHASPTNKLISRPLPSRSIVPGTYSDVGIEVRDGFPSYNEPAFRYHIYLVNGIGDDDSDGIYEQNSLKRSRDNNNNKAIGAQLAIFPIKSLEIAWSGYFGKWDDNDQNDTYITGPHLLYSNNSIEIRSEYLLQRIEGANGPGSVNAKLQGFYVQGAYKFSNLKITELMDKFELVLRYDSLKNNDGVSKLKQGNIPSGKIEDRIAVGLLFRPQDWMQIKMEYLHRNNEEPEKKEDNGIAFQAVVNW